MARAASLRVVTWGSRTTRATIPSREGQQGGGAHPLEADELHLVGADRDPGGAPHGAHPLLGPPQAQPEPQRQGRHLQVGQHGPQPVVAEAGPARGHRPVLPHHQRRGHQERRPVDLQQRLGGVERGVLQAAQPHGVAVDHHRLAVEGAVGDPPGVQQPDGPPRLGQRRVVDGLAHLGQRAPGRRRGRRAPPSRRPGPRRPGAPPAGPARRATGRRRRPAPPPARPARTARPRPTCGCAGGRRRGRPCRGRDRRRCGRRRPGRRPGSSPGRRG